MFENCIWNEMENKQQRKQNGEVETFRLGIGSLRVTFTAPHNQRNRNYKRAQAGAGEKQAMPGTSKWRKTEKANRFWRLTRVVNTTKREKTRKKEEKLIKWEKKLKSSQMR